MRRNRSLRGMGSRDLGFIDGASQIMVHLIRKAVKRNDITLGSRLTLRGSVVANGSHIEGCDCLADAGLGP